jgi:adenylate cyclase
MTENNFHFLRAFRVRMAVVLTVFFFLSMAVANIFLYRLGIDVLVDQLRGRLMALAQTASLMVDADVLAQIPLNRDGIFTPQFKNIAARLLQVKEANPDIKYIYTMARTDREGVWQFVVDPEAAPADADSAEPTAYPGDRYYAGRFPEMLKAFDGPAADKKIGRDEWGFFLSGYAPIRDKTGKAVAVLGVDMSAEDVSAAEKEIIRRVSLLFVPIVFIALALGVSLSRWISRRVQKLIQPQI